MQIQEEGLVAVGSRKCRSATRWRTGELYGANRNLLRSFIGTQRFDSNAVVLKLRAFYSGSFSTRLPKVDLAINLAWSIGRNLSIKSCMRSDN